MRTVLFAILGLAPALVQAADQHFDVLRVGNQVYSNVTVISSSPAALFIQHARGVGSVKLKDLSPELQQKFGYDPQKAASAEALQKQAQVDYVRTLTNAPAARVEPEPVTRLYAKSFLNQPAPEVVIDKWLSDPADTQDKFVMVEFWRTGSEPCRRVIPHLNALHQKYSDKLVIVGLSDEPEADVRALIEPKIEYFSAIDTQHRMAEAVELTAVPHVLLIDPKGIVRFQGIPGDLTEEKLDKILDQFAK